MTVSQCLKSRSRFIIPHRTCKPKTESTRFVSTISRETWSSRPIHSQPREAQTGDEWKSFGHHLRDKWIQDRCISRVNAAYVTANEHYVQRFAQAYNCIYSFSSFAYILARFNLIASLKRKFSVALLISTTQNFIDTIRLGYVVADEAFPRLLNDSDTWAEPTNIISWSENVNNRPNIYGQKSSSIQTWSL